VGDVTTVVRAAVAPATRNPFQHLALYYRDTVEYVSGLTTLIRAAVARDDAVLVAVPAANLERVRAGLALRTTTAGHADRVQLVDMAIAGRNPGRILPAVLLPFAEAHPGRRVTIVGEPIWPGRTALEYPACAVHEALINAAFAGREATICCPYDAGRLDATALADAARTHPLIGDGVRTRPSVAYADPQQTAERFNVPLPVPPLGATVVSFADPRVLGQLRQVVRDHGRAAGLTEDRADDLVVSANELAANCIEHAGGAGVLRLWTEPGAVVCQVEDGGLLDDLLAGRIPAEPEADGGRGLLLVNQLCDLVRVHRRADGTSVRMQITCRF
jgi:anti-sigma regulatory factor (Ser/Thr protein kinase)